MNHKTLVSCFQSFYLILEFYYRDFSIKVDVYSFFLRYLTLATLNFEYNQRVALFLYNKTNAKFKKKELVISLLHVQYFCWFEQKTMVANEICVFYFCISEMR